MSILVTGTAGFIGYHLAERLLAEGHEVVGVDNVDPYYDVALKEARLERLRGHGGFIEVREDLATKGVLLDLFATYRPRQVVHLAAQAGVRYSLEAPDAYIDSNITGFLNVLEACRAHPVDHLVYASSSSVYGLNETLPFSEDHPADHPVSLYAATKKSNEMMAHVYAHLFGIPSTGLRFFTVYGPWGRPDMALFLFTEAILAGRPIQVNNHGDMERDFTYVDDVVEAMMRLLPAAPAPDAAWRGTAPTSSKHSSAPHRVYNVGNHEAVRLMEMIRIIERCLGRQATCEMRPMQAGDVQSTRADVSALQAAIGWKPSTPIDVGVERFVSWYRAHYGV